MPVNGVILLQLCVDCGSGDNIAVVDIQIIARVQRKVKRFLSYFDESTDFFLKCE